MQVRTHPAQPGLIQASCSRLPPSAGEAQLLLDHLLDLPDFLLYLAGEFFILTFGGQVAVTRDLARLLFDLALDFKKRPLDLISRARFHL